MPDINCPNSMRGPGLFVCVSQGSTCHLVHQPDPGVLARKGMHTSHRGTEIAFASFLPNFTFVDILLFPRVFSFPSLLPPQFFFTVVYSTKKMSKKNNYGSEKKKDSKLPYVRPMGVSDFHFHRLVLSLA